MSTDIGLRILDFDIAISKSEVKNRKKQDFVTTIQQKNTKLDRKIAVKSKKIPPKKPLKLTTLSGGLLHSSFVYLV